MSYSTTQLPSTRQKRRHPALNQAEGEILEGAVHLAHGTHLLQPQLPIIPLLPLVTRHLLTIHRLRHLTK
jgi:hypothetical protein